MLPKIIRAAEGQPLMAGRQNIKLRAEDTDGMMSVLFSIVPAETGVPVHIHSHEDETFEITEGELEINLDGQVQLLKKGDMVFMPKNVPHGFKAIKDTQMWVTFVPAGAENMFVDFAALPPGPPEIAKISAIADGYGIKFV